MNSRLAQLKAAQSLALIGVALVDLKHLDDEGRKAVAKVIAADELTPKHWNEFTSMDIYAHAIGWATLLTDLYAVGKRYDAPKQSKQIAINQWLKSVDDVRDQLPRQKVVA